MQQEIRKLQTLNDLVSQTLDVLNQLNHRASHGGFSGSPFGTEGGYGGSYTPALGPTTYGVPYVGTWGAPMTNTPYGIDPRFFNAGGVPVRFGGIGTGGW